MEDGSPFEVASAIVATEEFLKGDDPIYGDGIKETWEWLTENERNSVDFGIAAFQPLWDGLSNGLREKMLAPAPNAAVLLPAHLDTLCQTSPQPEPSPDVSFFIHGPQRDNAEVSVCWRADLGEIWKQWPEIVRLLPPTTPECMTVPLIAVRKWIGADATLDRRDADVPVAELSEDEDKKQTPAGARRVTVWRGSKEATTTDNPKDLRPGDTVVIRTQDFGWEVLGHIPDAPTAADLKGIEGRTSEEAAAARALIERRRDAVDCAEFATRISRRRLVVRLHPVFPGRAGLGGWPKQDLRNALVEREEIKSDWREAKFDRHSYPMPKEELAESSNGTGGVLADNSRNQKTPVAVKEVILFSRLIDSENKLKLPDLEEDEDDSLSEADYRLSLDKHTSQVVDRIVRSVAKLEPAKGETQLFRVAADLHDLGKADIRFQAMLASITPYEAMERPVLLAKSGSRRLTRDEQALVRDRAQYPVGFRHEMLSTQIVEQHYPELVTDGIIDRELLLHLLAAHHGHARPLAPVTTDEPKSEELLAVHVRKLDIPPAARNQWVPSHRIDSGVAERFWTLTRKHGWWGLAYLESILRLADQQASAAEQDKTEGATR